ncbi:MAG TPA: hypothetical protein VMA71_07745 [Alloacidobacterium sp.]|nr:hypothetical protein [Alloacidobacterium sp.]
MLTGKSLCQAKGSAVAPEYSQQTRLISAVPMAFEENEGQLAPDLSFLGRAQHYSVAIEPDRLVFFAPGASTGSMVDVRFAGSRGGSPVSLSGVAYRSNYFIGSDPSRWHEGIANFSRVGIRQIYPGIDTEFYDKDGALEHDFIVSPGANPGTIRLDFHGGEPATLTAAGDAVIPASGGELRFRKPMAYQFDREGRRVAIDASYRLTRNSLRFVLGSYDHSRTLVIDPVILFATYVSGTSGSTPAQLATDGSGTLFIAGSTPSVSGFPHLPGSGTPTNDTGSGSSNLFVAALTSSQLGSALQWLTFLGNSGASVGTSIAYSSHNSGTLYVGGTTSAASFPGVPTTGSFGGTFPSGSGSVTGFVTSLNAGTGASPSSTYISSSGPSATVTDTTTVTGLAADSSGDVYVSGYGLGIALPLTASLGGTAIVPAAVGTNNNAFAIELDPALDTSAKLVTYVQSLTATPNDFRATGIQIDGSGNIYVGGQTFGATTITFPTSQSFASNGTYTAGKDFTGCSKASATDPGAFLAQIIPPSGSNTNSTIGFSAITCGGGIDHANALALGSNLFLVGDTTSSDFATKVLYSEGTTTGSATLTAGLQSAIAGSNANGFALAVPVSTGVPTDFTYLGGSSGTTILLGAALDTSNGGLLQLAGSTTANRADMPGSGAAGLPSGQDTSSAQPAGSTRGLLYTLTSDLSSAKAISYFGYTSSTSKAVSTQSDGAGDTYVLVNDTVSSATGPFSFASASAIQANPAVGNDAYVAEVQGTAVAATPAPGLTLSVATNSPEIDGTPCTSELACEIGYRNSSDFSTVLYTWNLNLSGNPADNVVLNFPEQDAFTSSSNPAYTIQADNGSTALNCVSKQNNNGTTCTFPSALGAGTHTVTLQADTGSNAQGMVGTSFAFDGNAADAEGEYSDAPQPSVTVANPVSISLNYIQTTGAINASSDTSGTGGTVVTYTATVTNTGTTDSPKTTLSITALPPSTKFKVNSITAVVGATNVIASCDATTGTGCASAVDVPAGSSLVYTITGVYLGPGFGTTTPGPYTFTFNASATALPLTANNAKQNAAPLTTTVNGYANLTVTLAKPPYPGAGYTNAATAFNLGAGPLTYTVTISNAGPNAVNTGTQLNFTNTLPTGFSVTSASSSVTGGAAATCSAAGTSCSITVLPSSGSIVYTIIGSFPDSATGAGAVPATAASASVTDTATLPTLPAGTYDPNSLTSAQSVTVQRLIHLKLTLAVTSTPTATGASYPTQPGFNLSTTTPVTYTYTVQNAGPDYAINVNLASLDAPPTGYTPPNGSLSVTPPVVAGLSCSGTPAANQYTSCLVANIAPSTSPTLAYTVLYPDLAPPAGNFTSPAVSAVPGNAASATWNYSISTPATYTNAVDNNVAGTTAGDNASATAATIYRTTHLKITVATPTATATGASYPSQPGYNLSSTALNYTYSIENDGPNIAVYVPLSNAFAQVSPPAGFTPPTGSVAVTVPTSTNLSCTTGATTLYSSTCTVGAVSPNTPATPLQLVFPVTYPDLAPPAGTYPAPESVSAVPTNQSSATYNYTTTTPATYTNSIDSNPAATTAGSNTFTAPASIYRTVHLKFTLMNSGSTVSGAPYALPPPNNANNAYNLGSAVQYSYQIQNTGPNIALNVPLSNTLAVTNPAVYAAPAGSYLVTVPSSGSVVCTLGSNNTLSSCGVEAIPPGTDNLAFNIAYPDLPPATYVFPTQDLSAVPSSVTNATYKYSTTTPAPYANAIDSNPTATAAGDNTSATSINLFRTSAMTLTTPPVTGDGTPCAPSSPTPCFYMANSGGPTNTGLFDTATYTVQVNNNGPNLATNSVLTIPLPANFLVTPNTSVAFNGIATTGVANQLVCTYQSTPNAIVCQGYVPSGSPQVSTVTITSKFSTATVPIGAAYSTTAASPGSASVTATAVGTYTPVNLPTVAIDRASHLVSVKLVGPAPTNVSPNGFTVNGVLAVNLDEKVAGDANGKNDTVQITQQVGNAGLNDATGVVITDTLPPYFILAQLPSPSVATCTVSGPTTNDAAGHPMTGAAPATLTCTLQNAVPRGTATAGSGSTHGTVSGAFAQVVYYGKFEDNGLQPDAVPLTAGSTTIQFSTLSATSVDIVNLGAASDSTSAPTAPVPVMRAAHLHFTATQYVQPGDAALNPVGGVTGPGIAEAQLGANGGEVINPVRYQVRVTNDGPNIATDPVVSSTLPPNPGGATTRFVNVSQSIEPSSTPGFPVVPTTCASMQACQDAGMIATGGAVLYNVDGNFDVNTLVEGNSGARTFASAVASANVVDSNPTASAGGDQQTSLPITVVNTPAGANFTMAPFAGNLAQPVNLKLTTVQIAGITGLAVSGASPAPAVPTGPSPNPPDNGATVPLYRFGQGGVYYQLGTTAGTPTATSNQTLVCLNSIPDIFQKPERVLLWALNNAPAGTAFGTVPHFTNTATEGDITTLALPQGGGSYSATTPSTSYPPPPAQPQPAEVCGVLNGLSSAANPTTLAVLEPVNFAPYIRTAVTAANSSNSQPGKGVTAAAAQVDLTISTANNYDYNDADPCYTGTGGATRSICNDNLQLTTFLFGGGNLIGDAQQVHTYFYGDIQATPKPQFNLPAGQPQLYLVLTDQLGAQGYKEMTSGGNTQVCDPGNPSTAYTPTTPACPLPTPLPTGIAVPPAQTILPLSGDSSVEVALLTGNVGFGGSTGLIPLPQTPTPEATANVTAGQTAGFSWNWLTEQPEVQAVGSSTPPVLTLVCTSADGTDLSSKGIQCNAPATYTYSTGTGNSLVITAPPAIYVVTTGNTAVGALHEASPSRDAQIVAAIVFPIGAIPLVLLARRRKSLKLTGWLAVLFIASIVGLGIGCGSGGFQNQGGTTTTATPAGTYQFIVTATGTDSNGNPISIKTYPFAVVVSSVP